jgi:hypothetical protein
MHEMLGHERMLGNEMLGNDTWLRRPTARCWPTVPSLRLIVCNYGGYVRYLIMHRSAGGRQAARPCWRRGTESTVSAAILAAKQAATGLPACSMSGRSSEACRADLAAGLE